MSSIITFFVGSSIGYFSSRFLSGSQVGQQGIIHSIILGFEYWQVHLHHWLIGFTVLILLLWVAVRKRKRGQSVSLFLLFFFGFCSGIIFQGVISYEDWHRIFIRLK